MRYLITGGAGFIGSHLSEALLEAGHDVLILDDFSTGRHENLAHLEANPRLRIHYGTITDREVVRECVSQVDQVFHLASAVGVQLIMDRAIETIKTIVEGSAVVLENCVPGIALLSCVYTPRRKFTENPSKRRSMKTPDSVIRSTRLAALGVRGRQIAG